MAEAALFCLGFEEAIDGIKGPSLPPGGRSVPRQRYTEIVRRSSRTVTASTGQRRNVTLTLSAEIVRRARHLAVERGVSLSKLLSSELENLVVRDEQYERARKRLFARMREGFDFGLHDRRPSWSRDELQER